MATLFPKVISFQRSTGDYVAGVWEDSGTTTLTFTGSVQPVSGKDLETVPTGRRDKGIMKIYSSEALQCAVQGSNFSGDIVIWAGKRWEVFQELPYQNSLIPHYKYHASYIGEAP